MGTVAPAGEKAFTCPVGTNALTPCFHGAIEAIGWRLTMFPVAKSSAWLR